MSDINPNSSPGMIFPDKFAFQTKHSSRQGIMHQALYVQGSFSKKFIKWNSDKIQVKNWQQSEM